MIKELPKAFFRALCGLAISAMYYEGNDLYVRILNNGSDKKTHHIAFNCYADRIQFVELNDKVDSSIQIKKNKVAFDITLPLFGFKTIKMINARLSP